MGALGARELLVEIRLNLRLRGRHAVLRVERLVCNRFVHLHDLGVQIWRLLLSTMALAQSGVLIDHEQVFTMVGYFLRQALLQNLDVCLLYVP